MAAAAPSPAPRRCPPAFLRDIGRWRSKSMASMTIAACSTRAVTAPCSMRSAGRHSARSQVPGPRSTRIEGGACRRPVPSCGSCRARPRLSGACAGEIAALAPEPGEETRLAEERAAMQAGAKAGESLTGLDELLGGSDGALAQLRLAARRIERGAADHPLLAEALAALDRARDRGERSGGQDRPRGRGPGVRPGPAGGGRGAAVRHSRAGPQASRRTRRTGCAWRGNAGKLAAIEAGGERIAELDSELGEARAALSDAAARCSLRREAASGGQARRGGRGRACTAQAGRRALPHRASPQAEPGPAGIDRVEFEVSTNPGAPFGPLTQDRQRAANCRASSSR